MRVSASSAPSGSSSARIRGLADQRARQRHALPLAAGQDRRPVAGAVGQADLGEHARSARSRASSPRGEPGQADRDIVDDARPGQQPRLLEHDARALCASAPPAPWSSVPRRRLVEPGEQPQQRALAAAALADDGEELARPARRGRCRRARPCRRSACRRSRNAKAPAPPARCAMRAARTVCEGAAGGDGRCGHGRPHAVWKAGCHCSEEPFEQPGEAVGELAEQRVDQDRQHDDVDQQELARLHRHVAEAGRGGDRLGDDQRQPHDAERVAQADEDRRQRAGQDHAAEQLRRLMP